MKEIGIIVPVYNTERFLERCLDSLINQSIIEKIKIIIINDGSKDNSEKIILKFMNEYPNNIEYYKTENSGLSSARNYGIKKCDAKYIGFVDSDDYVHKTMFEKMYSVLEREKADIVTCALTKCDNNEKFIEFEQVGIEGNIDKDNAINFILSNKIKGYAWNKLVKTSLFKDNNIFYPEGRLYEDIITSYKLIKKSNLVLAIDEPLYYYVQHKKSICYNPTLKTAQDILLNLDDMERLQVLSNDFVVNTLVLSISAYYTWYHVNKNKIKNWEINKYMNKLRCYKKRVNLFKLMKSKNIERKIKIKYIAFYLGFFKYIYFLKNKIQDIKKIPCDFLFEEN